jgi:four helix bundle protein
VRNFRELKVWAKAHRVTLDLYKITRTFPREEQYGLTSQIRRSAASIGANIAEGCGRGSKRELAQFLRVAAGSASELEYHLLLAVDLDILADDVYKSLWECVTEIKRMLTGFLRRLMADG